MKQLRVAMTGNNYPPEFQGGTERVMQALAREVAGAGDQVIVICGTERDGRSSPAAEAEAEAEAAEAAVEIVDGIPVYRLSLGAGEGYGLNLERPRLLGEMRRILTRVGIDVLHVHHWSHLSDGQVRLAKQLGLGVVVTLHDMWTSCPRFFRLPPPTIECPPGPAPEVCARCANLDFQETPEWAAERLARRDQDLTAELRAADVIVAPSEDCARACLEHRDWHGRPPLIEVLPHGLLDTVPAPARAPLGLPLRVGTFGNLNAEKGVLDLVAAMAGIVAELHLFGAGKPEFRCTVERQAKELGVKLHWHGPYLRSAPHPASQLDLAVFPSLCRETYGLVVDEALHHGTPVIVSNIGALPERAKLGGIAVSPGQIAELAKAIRGLVEEREAYHLLRAMIPTEFPTIVDTAATYRHLYAKAWATTSMHNLS